VVKTPEQMAAQIAKETVAFAKIVKQATLFEDPSRIANGRLTLKKTPGLGLTLSEVALAKFGERIL